MSYQKIYYSAFENLGCPVCPEDAISEAEIATAEERLGIRLPAALRDYYLVCGNEQRVNRAHNRLLTPQDWTLDDGKLIFMEENQAVVLWAIPIDVGATEDSSVFQAVNAELVEWVVEHKNCSEFLLSMLHWQASFGGGMHWVAASPVAASLVTKLDRNWSFVGEINQMRAYNKPGLAVCFLLWDDSWRVFAGANEEADIELAAAELGLEWEECEESED